eukprot:6305587-Prorocentrum_lima.AAC.1
MNLFLVPAEQAVSNLWLEAISLFWRPDHLSNWKATVVALCTLPSSSSGKGLGSQLSQPVSLVVAL